MTHHTAINIGLPADISYVGENVCVRQTSRREEGDGCVSVQGEDENSRVQSESRFAFPVFDKVFRLHFFEVLRGHSWNVCSCIGEQRRGR